MQSYVLQDEQKKLFDTIMKDARQVKNDLLDMEQNRRYQPLPVHRRDSSSMYYRGRIPGVNSSTRERNRIKRKITIPTHTGFNYAGLIIGPKGSNQKRLEEQTGCKILIRGRGSQKEGQGVGRGDFDDLHVLVAGTSEEQVGRAVAEIEKIIFADERTRTILRWTDQARAAASGGPAQEQGLPHQPRARRHAGPLEPQRALHRRAQRVHLHGAGQGRRDAAGHPVLVGRRARGALERRDARHQLAQRVRGGQLRGVHEGSGDQVKQLLEQIIDAHMKMKLNVMGNQRLNELNILANLQVPARYLSKVVGTSASILK